MTTYAVYVSSPIYCDVRHPETELLTYIIHSGLVVNEAIKSGFHIRNRGATLDKDKTTTASWSENGLERDRRDSGQVWLEKD